MIKAELKSKLKLVFQNHYYEDNYGNDLILLGVKEITRVQTDQKMFWVAMKSLLPS